MRSDDFDSGGELYTEDEFQQLAIAVKATPAFFGGLGELEDDGERCLVRRTSPWNALCGGGWSRTSFRWTQFRSSAATTREVI
jgi:hypothetical protein